MSTKSYVWKDWIERTLLSDIQSPEKPDPVPIVDNSGPELDTTEEFDNYRYGRGDGQYLYLLYRVNEPVDHPDDIEPIYIGETNSITSRLLQHFKKLRDSLPVESWEDDGSWGSWSKYDHMANVYDQTESGLYAWILAVDELDACPYGYQTYRQELEAKLVGLVHSQPQFKETFANREFVPNQLVHEMAKVGPDWLNGGAEGYQPTTVSANPSVELGDTPKSELWEKWVNDAILPDIRETDSADPIPLFETDNHLQVEVTESGGLKRSDAIDERIRREGKKCVHTDGVRTGTPDGLLYVMYQIRDETNNPTASDILPRYIGKGEAYGKKNELSANFDEVAKDLNATRSFARWGDGDYWHIGELSNTVMGDDSKKLAWANELFEQGTRTLKQQTYLWIHAWNPEEDRGPYGYEAYLAEAEPLLIGLALDAYPNYLLNLAGVPSDSPIKKKTHEFDSLSS